MKQVKRIGWSVCSGLSWMLIAGCAGAAKPESPTAQQAAAITAASAGAAHDDGHKGRHHERGNFLARFDANKNGVLELTELPENKRERMTAADADQNGSLTQDEVRAFHKSHKGKGDRMGHERFSMERLDANKNGTIEVAELPEHAKARLAAADTNNDGILSKDEMEAHHKAGRVAHFAAQDSNGDGALNVEEIGAKRWAFLSTADADKDGKVTQDEMKLAHESGLLPPPGHHRGRGEHNGNKKQ